MRSRGARAIAGVRGAGWAAVALHRTRDALRDGPFSDVVVRPPARSTRGGTRAVLAVLRIGRASCLERSLVLQRWLAAQGDERDMIIGVRSPGDFGAHAWLDGEPAPAGQGFRELARMAP